MYVPESEGERVDTVDGPGEFTGRSGQWDEHYEIDLGDGGTPFLHTEDIYPLQEDNPDR